MWVQGEAKKWGTCWCPDKHPLRKGGEEEKHEADADGTANKDLVRVDAGWFTRFRSNL
jgi:hypothetical protein